MKKFMKKLAKKSEGFTLVELIVVIAILGILAGVAVPAYSGYLTKANEAADITELDAIKTAVQAAHAKEANQPAYIIVTEGSPATTVKVSTDAAGTSPAPAAMTNDILKDFQMFYTATSIDLKTGTQAVWTGGDWTISTPAAGG